MLYLKRAVHLLSRQLSWVAGVALCIMAFLIVTNIIVRLFYRPILGTYEIVGFLGAMVAAFAVAHTQAQRGHVTMEIVLLRLPQRSRAMLNSVTSLILVVLSAIIAWRSLLYALDLWRFGEETPTLHMPVHFYVYTLFLCFSVLSLVFLAGFIDSLAQVKKR